MACYWYRWPPRQVNRAANRLKISAIKSAYSGKILPEIKKPAIKPAFLYLFLNSLKQCQHRLRELVRLCEHGSACLCNDL